MRVSDTAHRLKDLMSAYDINQQDIADKTQIPKSSISMYVSGKRVPRQDKVSIIADAYNIEPAWLMGYDVLMERGVSQRYSEESARLVAKLRKDTAMTEALQKYFSLSAKDKRRVTDFINMMSGE